MITLHERNGLPNLAAEDALPIVDAHHHLWDLGSARYPWLQDEYHEDFFLGDYHKLFPAAGEYNKVTREAIQQVARKYFTDRNRTVATLIPEKQQAASEGGPR